MRTHRKPGANGSHDNGERESTRHRLRSMRRQLESRDPELDRRIDPFEDDADLAVDDLPDRRRTRTLMRGEYSRGARRRSAEPRPL